MLQICGFSNKRGERPLFPWLLALGFLFVGCSSGEVPDDEAFRLEKERAEQEGRESRTVEEVALDFWPKQVDNYFLDDDGDGDKTDGDEGGRKVRGLNMIAVSDRGEADDPSKFPKVNALDVPIYQVLEPTGPEESSKLVYPVETLSETIGQNSWMIWCGGNEGFWDWLAGYGGLTDLLKLVDSRDRSTRFDEAGLINEPRMVPATESDEFGLWLDVPEEASVREFRRDYLDYAFETDQRDKGYVWESEGDSYPYGDPYKKNIPPPEIYGLSSGVVGLRLFPNPDFDDDAREDWDGARFYEDESYYTDPELIRPYRVGMSCAFCHASWHPLLPPRDLNSPRWENISTNIGAQYLRIRAVFGNVLGDDKENFVYHLLDSQPPGTIDTSLIPSDNLNNTNAMNSVFNVPQRVLMSFQNSKEKQSATSNTQPSLWGNPTASFDVAAREEEYRKTAYSPKYEQSYKYDPPYLPPYQESYDQVPDFYWKIFEQFGVLDEVKDSNSKGDPHLRRVPRILLDGADSIGAWGALARVYLNIGTFWEQWEHLHFPLVGFVPQKSFRIVDCDTHSAYWNATQTRVAPLRDYFLKVSSPMPLRAAEAPGREEVKEIDATKLALGRKVFAENCIVCHSSIQPETDWFAGETLFTGTGLAGQDLTRDAFEGIRQHLKMRRSREVKAWEEEGEFWVHEPGKWLQDPDYLKWAKTVVEEREFWRLNYLSIDHRIPVNYVKTNSARGVATNAMKGHMWSDFASESYQNMPSAGPIEFFNPYKGENGAMDRFTPRHKVPEGVMPGGGGPGFYRVPTLVSIWTTAPYLHNNSLGLFNNDPSVAGRMEAFEDGIRKLLWPEKRLESSSYNEATSERLKKDHGLIWRTTEDSYLELAAKQVPHILGRVPLVMKIRSGVMKWFPGLGKEIPLWSPSAVLLLIAFFGLWFVRRKWLRVVVGYAPIGLAVVACLTLYLFHGRLGNVRIGPIPKGTPVNLLANGNPDADPAVVRETLTTTIKALSRIKSQKLSEEEATEVMRREVAPALINMSKCPDFVMDKGHDFPWFESMTDADKEALIELLKTF